jgi:hypothetical protein
MNPTETTSVKTISLPSEKSNKPFGVEISGYLSVPTEGEYTFSASSDHGLHVWIHDARLFDTDHTNKPMTAKVRLSAGLHPIRIAYAHQAGAAGLMLRYAGPGITEQEIPSSALARDDSK